MKKSMILVAMLAMAAVLVGCGDDKKEPLGLHEDEERLGKLNPYVGIVVVLRGPLYLVAIASIIASVGFLLRANAHYEQVTRTFTKEEKTHG